MNPIEAMARALMRFHSANLNDERPLWKEWEDEAHAAWVLALTRLSDLDEAPGHGPGSDLFEVHGFLLNFAKTHGIKLPEDVKEKLDPYN